MSHDTGDYGRLWSDRVRRGASTANTWTCVCRPPASQRGYPVALVTGLATPRACTGSLTCRPCPLLSLDRPSHHPAPTGRRGLSRAIVQLNNACQIVAHARPGACVQKGVQKLSLRTLPFIIIHADLVLSHTLGNATIRLLAAPIYPDQAIIIHPTLALSSVLHLPSTFALSPRR